MLRVIHAGPSDYLDIDGSLEKDLEQALGKLRTSLSVSSPMRGKMISVLSHGGGSGCSLVAVNLAVAVAQIHEQSLLCDLNVGRGDLATFLNLKPQFSIIDLSQKLAKLQRDVFEQVLTPHESGIQLLAAPSAFADVQPIDSEAVTQVIGLGKQMFPYTIVDLEDFFHMEQLEAIHRSDTVLFVMRLDYTSLRNARRTFDYLDRDGIDSSQFQLVVNQYGRPRELSYSQAEEVLGRTLDHYIPYEPKVAIESINRGEPAMLASPRSKIARAIQQIAGVVAPLPGTVTTS